MVSINKIVFDRELLDRVRKNLRLRSTGQVFNFLPLETYTKWILNRLKKDSGRRSPQNVTEWLKHIRAGGESASSWASAMLVSFSKGWRDARATNTGSTLVFSFGHELEDHGKEGRERFLSIINGTRTSFWESTGSFSFKMLKNYWISFKQGQTFEHKPTEPDPVMSKVSNYVNGYLAQQITRDLTKVFL